MKKTNFIIFILFSYYCYCTITTCSGSKYHLVDVTSPSYEYDIELDWTDIDEKTISIPFSNLQSVNDIIPLFVNSSVIDLEYYDVPGIAVDAEIESKLKEYANTIKKNHYNLYDTANFISDYTLDGASLKFTLKSTQFQANQDDVNQKYLKYFCWYECDSNDELRFRQSGIIVTVNNAKLLKLSKYLMGFLLLFL